MEEGPASSTKEGIVRSIHGACRFDAAAVLEEGKAERPNFARIKTSNFDVENKKAGPWTEVGGSWRVAAVKQERESGSGGTTSGIAESGGLKRKRDEARGTGRQLSTTTTRPELHACSAPPDLLEATRLQPASPPHLHACSPPPPSLHARSPLLYLLVCTLAVRL